MDAVLFYSFRELMTLLAVYNRAREGLGLPITIPIFYRIGVFSIPSGRELSYYCPTNSTPTLNAEDREP